MSDADDLLLLTVAVLMKRKQLKNKKKRIWMQEWLKKRNDFTHENLLDELRVSSTVDYGNFLRMDATTFEDLLQLVGPKIEKKNTLMRQAIPVTQRLSITLRYLATGNSFEDLKFLSAISPQSISNIVMETCEALITSLKEYIRVPKSEEEWKLNANKFYKLWNFPNCLGAVDGKHVAIKKPIDSGSMYYNYKKFFSIVLMAVVNANYEFIVADVGVNGRVSDGGVLKSTSFGKALHNNILKIPPAEKLPRSDKVLPYVFIGDNAFQMLINFLKPYSGNNLTEKERIFNYRLSRARRIVENVFGILVSRFGVLQKTINLEPEKAKTVVLSCCYVHNFLRSKMPHSSCEINKDVCSYNISQNMLQNSQTKNCTQDAKNIRNAYTDYFFQEGQIPWQK